MMKLSTIGAVVKRRQILFHPVRSLRFVRALMLDRRISLARKAVFVLLVSTMLLLLLFPDIIEESILSTVMPVLGTILGIPLDVGFNWAAFAVVSVYLLRLFPADVVHEIYSAQILRQPGADDSGSKLVTRNTLL